MATLTTRGTNSLLVYYVDDNGRAIRLVIAHIVDYADAGNNMLQIERVTGTIKIKLDNQAAVDDALVLLDSKF